jgi:hypothetical protein
MRHFPDVGDYNNDDKKLFWFCGVLQADNETLNMTMGTTVLLINFYIWETKLKKSRLSLATLEMECEYVLDKCLQISRKLRLNCKKINMPFFRKWTRDRIEDGGREGEHGREREEEE